MYYIYHIIGHKIGVTRNPEHRVEKMQGCSKTQYEILEKSSDIDYISNRELELQKKYNYRVDKKLYKNLFKTMNINSTAKTTTFPCSKKDLKKWLNANVGESWTTPEGDSFKVTKSNIPWLVNNAQKSQFREDSCYIYNDAFITHNKMSSTEVEMFSKIRDWAEERGIYDKGDPKTQLIKLFEEAGELSQSLLKKDSAGIIDAIGDCTVVLTNLAHLCGYSIEYCVDEAYNEIAARKGEMKNGTFVKETL